MTTQSDNKCILEIENRLSRGKKITDCPEFETLSSLVQYNAKSGFSPPDKGGSRRVKVVCLQTCICLSTTQSFSPAGG